MLRPILAVLAAAVLAAPQPAPAQDRAPQPGWVGAWQASPAAQPSPAANPLKPIRNQTVRQRVKVSVGGRRVRVTLSNAYGSKPLVVGAASVGRLVNGQVDAASIRPLVFAGSPGITIPVGAPALSDPVDLELPAFGEAVVSLYLPQETLPETYHRAIGGGDTAGTGLAPTAPEAVISPEGDFTRQAAIPGAAPNPRLFVTRVDVLQPAAAGAVVVLGTTRTIGDGRWPEHLARRLGGRRPVAVVNASMVANPLTRPYPGGGEPALARFDRDVLMVPGVSHLIIVDAINDIGQAAGLAQGVEIPTVESLAMAYRQMVARAHARGVKVIAATMLPFAGVPFPNFYSPEKERVRQGLNQWIRTSGAFDGVIDMEAMVRDPADPSRYAAGLDAANHFAPNEAGEKRIGEGIDVRLFR
jgi:hypothetical protein